jgi:hypothetical protein
MYSTTSERNLLGAQPHPFCIEEMRWEKTPVAANLQKEQARGHSEAGAVLSEEYEARSHPGSWSVGQIDSRETLGRDYLPPGHRA